MFQIKFNDDFSKLVIDISHWEIQEDIPEPIRKFILDTSDKRIIYVTETEKFYCGKCAGELDDNHYCEKCNIQHGNYTLEDITKGNIDIHLTNNIRFLDDYRYYFTFDIRNENVYLYFITEQISYYNPLSTIPYKSSKVTIDDSKSYLIERHGVTNLETNEYISFQLLAQCYKESETGSEEFLEEEELSDSFRIYEDFELIGYRAYLYTDNLVNLKNTIYKYSKIWELSNYLKEQYNFNISQFTFYPLYYSQFEYLVNYRLYNLAWHVPNWFPVGKNFKEIFGVDKKYLSFMAENNIDYEEFKILKIYPTMDMEVLKFFSRYCFEDSLYHLVKDIKVDLKKLKEYLISINLSSHYISEYLDYIRMAQELHLDLRDKRILYPNNLRETHDELYNQIETVEDSIIDEKIARLANILSINRYENSNYIIYPAASIADLVEESKQQKNCVRTYCERIANDECHVYFMRKKEEVYNSFVTIEVCNNKIVQARLKYNELPGTEIKEILEKWEENLIPIVMD